MHFEFLAVLPIYFKIWIGLHYFGKLKSWLNISIICGLRGHSSCLKKWLLLRLVCDGQNILYCCPSTLRTSKSFWRCSIGRWISYLDVWIEFHFLVIYISQIIIRILRSLLELLLRCHKKIIWKNWLLRGLVVQKHINKYSIKYFNNKQ
jgi:hypothetical protein